DLQTVLEILLQLALVLDQYPQWLDRNESANSCCFARMQVNLWTKYYRRAIPQKINRPIPQKNQTNGTLFLYGGVLLKSFEWSSYACHAERKPPMDQYADPQALYFKYSLVVLLTIFTHNDQCNNVQT